MYPNLIGKFSMGKREYRVAVMVRLDGRYELIVKKMSPTSSRRIKKFIRGPRIKSVSALARQIQGHKYVFYGKRPCHWSWLGSMSLFTLNHLANHGILSYARPNPKYPRLPF